jgi:chaperonin GroEL (HSP60 family)
VAIYEVTYSTKPTSKDESCFSDIILVEAETHEELYTKVVDTLLRILGQSGNYYVDSIEGNPYEPASKKRIAKKMAKEYQEKVRTINALISKRNQGP